MSRQREGMRVATLQMISGGDSRRNFVRAVSLLERARDAGAEIALLPENFLTYGMRDLPGTDEQRAFISNMADLASSLGLWLVAGSYPLSASVASDLGANTYPNGEKPLACCLVFDDSGECRGCYAKIHLFDVDVDDNTRRYRESDDYAHGKSITSCDSPWGHLGFAICYDLRFPELFVVLAKRECTTIFVPAAFTEHTGKAHWQILLRARAIEGQCFVVASNQGGKHDSGRSTWGESMIVNPWGEVVSKLGKGEGVLIEYLDFTLLYAIRKRMPVHRHRRIKSSE